MDSAHQALKAALEAIAFTGPFISLCHCGVERETAMIGKEVRAGADVDHDDE
jgi:hypothetical protein